MTHAPFPHGASPREPLTPDEQALARRLASLDPHGGPSPDLDARILAAAHAATDRPLHPAPRTRWPVALGLAASLLLAVGIAWRLRPLPAPVAPQAAAPVVDVRAQRPPEREARQDTAPAAAEAAPAPPPPAPPARVVPRLRSTPVPADTPAASDEQDAAFDDAPPTAAALPAPPAPAAPPSDAGAPAMAARKAAADVPPPPEDQGTESMDAAEAANQATGDEPEVDVPPATAESPEVRDAWLARIRELAAQGQTDAARASLKEFVRRHPDVAVPDDLRALSK